MRARALTPVVVNAGTLEHLRGSAVLIVTATAIELAAVRELLTAFPEGNVYRTSIVNETYYSGLLGVCPVIVVKCEMGTTGRDAALAVCMEALHVWRPRAAIMVGIAFGKDAEHQQMCDVLVASHIIPYELAKRGRAYVPRAAQPPTDALLFNRFVNATAWTFYRQGRSRVQIRPGAVLTGEKVVDNPRVKSQLFKLFPHAIGGEMEGAGLFAAAARRSTPWMLAKAICDWGDGTKNDKFQRRAAAAAASLLHHVLSEEGALDDLPIPAIPNDTNPFRPALSTLRFSSPSRVEVVAKEPPWTAEIPARHSGELVASSPSLRQANEIPTQVSESIAASKRNSARPKLVLLGPKELDALRLIGTAPVGLPATAFDALFPRVKWRSVLRSLRRKKIVATNDPHPLVIASSVRRSIFEDGGSDRYEARWLRRLEALREHTDTAVLLALLHLRAKRYEDAIAVLANVAMGLEPGHDNAFYRGLLTSFMAPRMLRKISSEGRIHLLNAYGMCLANDGEYVKSLPIYARLLNAGRAARNAWGIGQAYINSGVSHFHLGNLSKAQRSYELAIRHAKRAKDPSLEGRALNNLGLMVSARLPAKGATLIAKALKLKLACGDITGVAGTLMGQGNLHSKAGRHREALERYREAETLARRLDMRHLRGLALSNLGSSHVDLREPNKAVPLYGAARAIATQEGFQDVLRFATQGEAVARSHLKQFRAAMALFLELADLQSSFQDDQGVLSALHDAGVMGLRAGDQEQASGVLKRALRLAERAPDESWIYRCRLALAEVGVAGPLATSERLRRAAIHASARGHHQAASRLWLAVLDRAMESTLDASRIDRLGTAALGECAKSQSRSHTVEVYKRLCVWRRNRNEPAAALEHARKLEGLAKDMRNVSDRIAALDEQAACCQRLGNVRLAERLHRKALLLAEASGDRNALATPLVNLAALLRNTGRLAESRKLLRRAHRIAVATADVELEAHVAGNTALVLADEGQQVAAKKLLTSWLRKTAALEMWPEHVVALHRLANLAFTAGQLERADNLYGAALDSASQHEDRTQPEIAHNYVLLLTERMRAAVHQRQHKVAERAFERAKAITEQYSLKQNYRDLLIALGDAQWRLGTRGYAKGTQAYVAALTEIPDVAIEEALRLNSVDGAALVLHFYRIPQSQPLARIEALVAKSRVWFRRQGGGELDAELEAFLFWPLEVGVRVAALVRSPQPPDAKLVGELVASGFKEAVAKLRG